LHSASVQLHGVGLSEPTLALSSEAALEEELSIKRLEAIRSGSSCSLRFVEE
jgi:hypothetical protein